MFDKCPNWTHPTTPERKALPKENSAHTGAGTGKRGRGYG